MKSTFNKLEQYITEIDNRNKNTQFKNLIGVTIAKDFIPSVANVIGTDLSNYKIISKNQFACSLMQVSRDGGIAVALYNKDIPAIMSPAYHLFEVKSDKLLPEYLDMILKSKEFDRAAVFYAVGGVRGTLTWEEFCDMRIPVPSIQEQEKIVHDYKVVVDRIELLKKVNNAIEKTCLLIYKKISFNKGENACIGDLITINNKSKIQVGNADLNGCYPFFTSGESILKDSNCLVDGINLYINTGGKFDVKFYDGKASYSTDTLSITTKNELTYYLYFYLKDNYSQIDERCFHGSALQHLQKNEFLNLKIYKPNEKEINNGIYKINKLMKLVTENKLEISLLSNLKTILLSNLTKEV